MKLDLMVKFGLVKTFFFFGNQNMYIYLIGRFFTFFGGISLGCDLEQQLKVRVDLIYFVDYKRSASVI